MKNVNLAAYFCGVLMAECTVYNVKEESEYAFFLKKFSFCNIDIDITEE